jgi:DNA-binding response OmpR family regulator
LRVADLVLDARSRRTARGEVEIELSAREFAILQLLLQRAGQLVTRSQILDEVWDGETDLRSNLIDVHVASLRAKIDRPFGTDTITTLRGAGYRIDGGNG